MLEKKIREKLSKIVGDKYLKEAEETKGYAVDDLVPQAVLFPGTAEEVERIVILALEEGMSVVPWGGGTQMDLGAPPKRVDLVLCLNRLDRVLDQDYENMTFTAEAGIRLGTVQEKLRQLGRGFFLPLDPPCAKEVTLGGALATNASGPKRLRYGTLRDLVLGVEVVIPEEMEAGCKICAGGKTVKNVSGYDMDKLYIGSLGTLAIIVEVTCKILPVPEDRATVVGGFTQTEAPWACTQTLLESQLIPSCIEVFNREASSLLPLHTNSSVGNEVWAAVGFEGNKEAVEREVAEVEKLMRSEGAKDIQALRGADEDNFWEKFGRLGLEVRTKKAWSIGIKASVPISMAQKISMAMEEEAKRFALSFYHFAHAGNGIVYSYIPLDEGLYGEKEEKLAQMVSVLRKQAEEMEGSLVVKHAPAAFKQRIDVWGEIGGMFPIMERLKREFDPKGILNPGRFVGGI